MLTSSLLTASWLDTCPTEIRQYIFKLLGLSLDAPAASNTDALLDGFSLLLAYPQFLDLYQYIKVSLEVLPAFNEEEQIRFSEYSLTATLCPVSRELLHVPKAVYLQLDSLHSKQLERDSIRFQTLDLSPYTHSNVLRLFPNISSITLTCSDTYTYCSSHEVQLCQLIQPIEHQLQELQISFPISSGSLYASLVKCFVNTKLQKVIIQGFMSMASVSFLKEQKHIQHFVATEVNGHALEQVVCYWPSIHDLDIAGIALFSSAPSVCRALYRCSNQLRRLTLSGTCEEEVRGCLGWMAEDQDEDSLIESISAGYKAVIGCCSYLTHLSISKFPICGEILLPLLKQRLRKLEELEFVSRPASQEHNSLPVYPCT
ncbi:hypothetical protein K450DRAFT_268251 [Umbelopsis ramanniana AG]|uniref:Uncharacterized protein n=1 Tax=Umbelopsis ramanniana AG TaxID=1314678 RepID=A0AAD5EHZ2_UMBRA|nr:uncharacterized protein K450DRAFT_268251 [Umbelopsis ramanniana AG]KAI8583662.1 hypothetical protein K450DRAFT_268251 [Umbelopsis ramanniana AG]